MVDQRLEPQPCNGFTRQIARLVAARHRADRGLVLLCIAGTLLNSDFASLDNAMNVLTRTAFIGIIAVGMCFVIISGGIDLSVGSMAALIAGCIILLMNTLGGVDGSAGAGGRHRHGRSRSCWARRSG